jgi:Fe-S-cluster containining protein
VPAEPENPPRYVTATIELTVAGKDIRLEAPVPTGPVRPVQLLPLFTSLSDTLVGLTAESVEQKGKKISCKKGCGACCRQLVPISPTEAYRIREMIDEMPEPRRSQIRARFEDARKRLDEGGLLERLLEPEKITQEETVPLGMEYFSRKIACPFLEEESCSIHPDRPIACREYLVTTPAKNCSTPTGETVRLLETTLKASTALRCLTIKRPGDDTWVPLILAPSWAKTHPDESIARPGTELVREFFSFLKVKDVPNPDGEAT